MGAAELQSFLRFLSQDAKVPLAMAMGKIKDLQKADLDSPDKLAKAKADDIKVMFPDEKVAKQIITAAKRVAKKRAAGDDATGPSPSKKKKKSESLFSEEEPSPAELEASLELPSSDESEEILAKTVLFTNRAPLALAFVLTLLKYSMPEQPLSSRLSLAQGYISITSRARAVYLGIESGRSAEEEGFGEGAPSVNVTGKEIKVLRRWDYEWKDSNSTRIDDGKTDVANTRPVDEEGKVDADVVVEREPALWAIDLEAVKKANYHEPIVSSTQSKGASKSALPIYQPQSARAYLLKAFDTAPDGEVAAAAPTSKKASSASKVAEKERNLGKLLKALTMLYDSWSTVLSGEDLDKRTWGWYVKVRPDVADGVAGWGGKNKLKLADILALRRVAES